MILTGVTKRISIAIVVCALFGLSFAPALADDPTASAFAGLRQAATRAYGDNQTTLLDPLPTVIGRVIGSALAFIGVIFFVLIVYGGFLWMTARGNDSQVGKAKDLIGAAIVGLAIVLMAYAITSYVSTLLITRQ